jgi:LPXTG-motif cell wall-anchored protein
VGRFPPADGGGDTGGGGTGTDDTDTDAAALAATGQESGIIGMLGGLTLLLGAALIIRARIRRGSIQ